MNRAEHLQWCKDRAMEYVDSGDLTEAVASMCSDLNKHKDTRNHAGIQLGMSLMMAGKMGTTSEARKFIEGFN